jgi:hypothetical protein
LLRVPEVHGFACQSYDQAGDIRNSKKGEGWFAIEERFGYSRGRELLKYGRDTRLDINTTSLFHIRGPRQHNNFVVGIGQRFSLLPNC